ncbi:MAG: hypothetical protein CMJ79_08085 [Planctomycetaceae bacterium]|nr:hypothetical protein [Planctomycetaceae bacterium]|tara:strand:- start:2078 stop:2275 length:198 start_codon:yes stop_codon:yes gene_type:complete
MQQVKIFKSIESELSGLEQEINEWITTENVNIINIFGNIAPQSLSGPGMGSFSSSDVLITILYQK